MRHINVKTVQMFLRRRHSRPLGASADGSRRRATGATSGTFLDDEQFEVLESGAMCDEVDVSGEFASGVSDECAAGLPGEFAARPWRCPT